LSLEPKHLPSIKQYPSSELKALLSHLKYVYFGEKEALSVIIASHLTEKQEDDLLMLRDNKEAIGWTMTDIKGLNPLIVQHVIHLIKEAKLKRDPQHKLNPIMQEVVRVEY